MEKVKRAKKTKTSRKSQACDFQTIDGVIESIRQAKKIIVITGAGISVSCGIPDFRSKDVGLYNNLDCSSLEIPSAELLFDLEFFRIDPLPFYKFCKTLIPKAEVMPSLSHAFISTLEKKKKLLRNYTQNIDGLEKKVGISDSKLIECHGSMSKFKCTKCSKKLPLADVVDDIQRSQVLYCSCGNVMKPMVTFFGEDVPVAFNKAIEVDATKCDLVIVIGTSLKVGGSVVSLLANTNHVPHILINRDMVIPPKATGKGFDAVLLGDCDCISRFICESLGWVDAQHLEVSGPIGTGLVSSEKIDDCMFNITFNPIDITTANNIAVSSFISTASDVFESPTSDNAVDLLGKRKRRSN